MSKKPMTKHGYQSRFLGETGLPGNGLPQRELAPLLLFGPENGIICPIIRYSGTFLKEEVIWLRKPARSANGEPL